MSRFSASFGKLIRRRFVSSDGVPRIRTEQQQLGALRKQAQSVAPIVPGHKPKLMTIPKVKFK